MALENAYVRVEPVDIMRANKLHIIQLHSKYRMRRLIS